MCRVLLCFVLICFSVNGIYAQQVSPITVNNVYWKIIDAIGNNNPRAPKLEIVDSESDPASYKSESKIIAIENKVLKVCHSFGPDSLNALSYILGHELGHHYRNHGWMSHYASLEFSNPLNEQVKTPQQRETYEIEADIYAGFYAHIAGFDALKVADVFLDSIYSAYSFRHDLENYPTLDERKRIIVKNKKDFEELKNIFDLANVLLAAGYFDYSQELYYTIIDKGFTSREIYNNLGLTYIQEALNLGIEGDNFKALIPFKIDFSTRLETEGTSRGSINTKQYSIELLKNAKKEFGTANKLDPNYCPAKENLFFTEMTLAYLNEKAEYKSLVDYNTENCNICKYCVKGHFDLINNKINSSIKSFTKGASACPICRINSNFKTNQLPKKKTRNLSEFDMLDVNGIDMFCKDFNSNNCDNYYSAKTINICKSNSIDCSIVKLKRKRKGKTSCISIQEITSDNEKWKNNLGIYIGDDVSKLLTKFKDTIVINSANDNFIAVKSEQLLFLIESNIISKWYYFERLE